MLAQLDFGFKARRLDFGFEFGKFIMDDLVVTLDEGDIVLHLGFEFVWIGSAIRIHRAADQTLNPADFIVVRPFGIGDQIAEFATLLSLRKDIEELLEVGD